MKHDEKLVERVTMAMAQSEADYGTNSGYRVLALAALDELAPELRHDPPLGCPKHYEAVWLPPDAVDAYGASRAIAGPLIDACRATKSRRPKPEPRTERVPWGSHLRGRFVPREPTPITSVWCGPDGIERYGGDGWERSVCSGPVGVPCDGKVEVLAKDDQ